jgi:pyruvate,water dikinase
MTILAESSNRSSNRSPADRFGGKAATLIELQAAGFRVPDFVVSPASIEDAVARLGLPLAVRSSASAEDGSTASFAGQFRSFLNLGSVAEVRQAVESCRASLHQPAVGEYCRQQGIRRESMRMEVIVQRMIQPELAGVAFTVNPVSGQEEVLIEACEGLADDLLAGHQEPLAEHHPLLQRHRGEIERVARRIQQHFGSPQDVEFAVHLGEVFVLQSRPITRIGFAGSPGQWTNADFRDGGVSSTVCTPLMWSLYKRVWDESLKDTLRELRLFRGDFEASRMFFGRPYWNLAAVKGCLARLPGFVERDFDEDLSVQINYEGDGHVTPVTLPRLVRAIPPALAISRFFRSQRWAAEQLLCVPIESPLQDAELTPGEVEAEFRQLIESVYLRVESTYFRNIFAASLAKLDFMSAFPEADYASLVSALPPLRHVEPVRMVQAMPHRCSEGLARVIRTYRHHYRCGLDLIHPRWDEDQQFVERMLAELPAPAGTDPRPIYESARAAMLSRLPRWKHSAFSRKLNRLRHFLWLREQLRDYSNQIYYLIRRRVLELAHQRELGDDIFFQTYEEIFSDNRTSIDRNRDVYESYRNFRAPNEIGRGFHFDRGGLGGDFCGIGASPGCVSAKAMIARNVAQAAGMPRGLILVCPHTDPGWTAVLDRAGGVVTETGGLLSHAAILCREYGIPAVLGVERATERIAEGANLTIDGGKGRVRLITFPEDESI